MPLSRRSFLNLSVGAATVAASSPSLSWASRTPISLSDYRALDALALAEGIRRKDFSATEVLETAIARAEAINPAINAIVEPLYDYALNQIKQGLPEGPFAGVPFLLKDLGLMLEGTTTTEG